MVWGSVILLPSLASPASQCWLGVSQWWERQPGNCRFVWSFMPDAGGCGPCLVGALPAQTACCAQWVGFSGASADQLKLRDWGCTARGREWVQDRHRAHGWLGQLPRPRHQAVQAAHRQRCPLRLSCVEPPCFPRHSCGHLSTWDLMCR